jgi:hypothetical protein
MGEVEDQRGADEEGEKESGHGIWLGAALFARRTAMVQGDSTMEGSDSGVAVHGVS